MFGSSQGALVKIGTVQDIFRDEKNAVCWNKLTAGNSANPTYVKLQSRVLASYV